MIGKQDCIYPVFAKLGVNDDSMATLDDGAEDECVFLVSDSNSDSD